MKKFWPRINRFAVALIAVGFAALLQTSVVFDFGGVKPNFTLAALIALSFFMKERIFYFSAIFFALLILRFKPEFELTALAMVLISGASFFARNLIPGKPFINNLILIALGTPVFYLIADPNFVLRDTFTVFEEMFYNVFLGAVFFFAAKRIFRHEEEFRFTV